MIHSRTPNDGTQPGADPSVYFDMIDSYWEWDIDDEETRFNPRARKLTGYSAEELEGGFPFWDQVIHPEDRKILRQLRTWALRRTSPVFETNLRLKSKSGIWVWHLIRCTVSRRIEDEKSTRVFGVMIDISQQESYQSTLEETGNILRHLHTITTSNTLPLQERLNRILEAGCAHFGLPNGIISHIVGEKYEVLAVHTEGNSINAGDVYDLGKTFCNETIQFGGAVFFEDAGRNGFKTHPCYLEFGLATYIGIPIEVDGKIHGTLNFSAPTPRAKSYSSTDNEILKLMGQWVGSALTRTQLDQTLHETEMKLQHAQRLETVGRLVSGVAHDINNLLTAVIGYTDLARMDLSDDHPMNPDLEQAVTAAKRGARITRRLLSFSRPGTDSPQALNLDESISDTSKLLAQMAGDGVRFTADLRAGDANIFIDPAQLDQVLLNLAVNARDAMPGGGTLTISTSRTGNEALVIFSDTGIGMDEKTANRVFEPFFTTKNPEVGTGLGLATVHSIINKAGGSVNITTAVDRGTAFRISLPLATKAPTLPAETVRMVPGPSVITVLLIEGEALVRHTVTGFLEKAGHRVVAADSGKQAEKMWLEKKGEIHLIVSDVLPPGSPGWEFPMSANNQDRHPVLLFMSAYPKRYLEKTGHPALRFPVIEKPFDFEALNLKLGQILKGED